jgi:hypothetical protein
MIISNFHVDRIFFQSSHCAGQASGWYFEKRDGKSMGPFLSRECVRAALQFFVKGRSTSNRR